MTAEECTMLNEFSRNLLYHFVIFTKGCLCGAGAYGIIMQWKQQGVRFLGHDNSKIFFTFYYFLNLLTAVMCVCVYLIEVIRLRFDCFLLDFRLVLILKGVIISSVLSAHHIIAVLSLERLYSSFYPAHFEKYSNRKLSFLLAISTTVFTSFYIGMCVSSNFNLFYKHNVALLDERVVGNAHTFSNLLLSIAVSSALSIMLLIFDYYMNFIKRRITDSSLAVSYQFAENRRVILILLPIELTNTFLTLITAVSLIIFEIAVTAPSPMNRQMFLDLITFPALHPLILAVFIEFRVGRQKRPKLISIGDGVDHFESLRRLWEGPTRTHNKYSMGHGQ